MRAYKVYAIKNGTVIDHIPNGKGLEIINILGLSACDKIVTLGMCFTSKKIGLKDIIKIENKEFDKKEVEEIAIIAPTATLNIIRNFKVYKKISVEIPEVIEEIIKCANPACITNFEDVKTKFLLKKKKNPLTNRS